MSSSVYALLPCLIRQADRRWFPARGCLITFLRLTLGVFSEMRLVDALHVRELESVRKLPQWDTGLTSVSDIVFCDSVHAAPAFYPLLTSRGTINPVLFYCRSAAWFAREQTLQLNSGALPNLLSTIIGIQTVMPRCRAEPPVIWSTRRLRQELCSGNAMIRPGQNAIQWPSIRSPARPCILERKPSSSTKANC